MPLGAARFGLLGGVADLGKLELIETQTWTTTTNNLEFTNLKEDIYNVHFIVVQAKPNGGSGSFYYRTSSNGGTSYDSTSGNYQFAVQRCYASGTFTESRSSNAGVLEFYGNAGAGDYARVNRYTYMYNAGNSSKYTFFTDHSTADDTTNTGYNSTFASGVRVSTSVVNAIQFFTNVGGGFLEGEASLYGIAES
jgi:hypothetical protein